MAKDYSDYNSTPEHQKKQGRDAEWAVVHKLQEHGYFVGRYQSEEQKAPRIYHDDYGYLILPDIWAARDGKHILVEVKSKAPTAYGSFGIPRYEVRGIQLLADAMNADPLFVVHDTATKEFLVCPIIPEVLNDAHDSANGYFIRRDEFEPFDNYMNWFSYEHYINMFCEEQLKRNRARGIAHPDPLQLPEPIELDPDLEAQAAEIKARFPYTPWGLLHADMLEEC